MSLAAVDRLKWFARTVRLLENWPEYYTQRFSRRQPAARQLLKLRSGARFEVAHKDRTVPILMEVMQRRVYAPGLQLSDSPTIVDIGGHIGAASVFFARSLPSARVYVFEPEPLNFELLERNLRLNGVTGRVTPVRKAVGGAEGVRTLFARGNSPVNSLVEKRRQGEPIDVDCTSLEGIFETYRLEKCDLLKIDCEGAEYEILFAAPASVLSRVGRVILEWHDVPGHSPEQLEQHLRAAGFSTYRPRRRIIVGERR